MATAAGSRTPAQLFALVFGAVYLLVGIAGFFVTGFDNFAGETYNDELIIFPVNPLHNLVHLAIGAVWLGSAARHDTAKSVNLLIGAAYALVALLGFVGVLNFLAIEDAGSADNFLHLATALLAIYFGTAGAENTAGTATA
ncbi:MAG: DUF4383 domain-containing protein [Actinomycetota bacterium]